jgi:3-dehydroquinate dehydratase-1
MKITLREVRLMGQVQRLRPTRPIPARSGVLGAGRPMVCIPLVGKNRGEIIAEAENIPAIAPDIIELRVDAWDFIEDVSASAGMVRSVRSIVKDTPMILTCRGDWEGGFKKVSDESKFALYLEAAKGKLADFIDVELAYGKERIQTVLASLEGTNTSLIVSFHDFKKTPPREDLADILKREAETGAHVLKLAAMPIKEEDVLDVLYATLEARRNFPAIPIITMSMGPMGAVTRIIGGLFGSDLTFAVGSKSSAPGQIPVAELRKCFDVVYPTQTEE